MNTAASFNPKVDAQYKVRDVVPDFQTFLDRWAAASLWARANLRGHLNIQYGPSAEETLDVFLPHAQTHTAPVQILIHGGYWRALSKDDFSFLAAAIVPASAVAIVINYALCPAVTLDRIVDQCRRALVWTSRNAATYGGDSGRLHVTGHSAGAHLAAMLAATDWSRFESGLHPALRSICGVSAYILRVEAAIPPMLSIATEVISTSLRSASGVSPLAASITSSSGTPGTAR